MAAADDLQFEGMAMGATFVLRSWLPLPRQWILLLTHTLKDFISNIMLRSCWSHPGFSSLTIPAAQFSHRILIDSRHHDLGTVVALCFLSTHCMDAVVNILRVTTYVILLMSSL